MDFEAFNFNGVLFLLSIEGSFILFYTIAALLIILLKNVCEHGDLMKQT
jgi:hypothetical protein